MNNYYRLRCAEVTNNARELADLGENKQTEKELIYIQHENKKSKFAGNEDLIGMMQDQILLIVRLIV